MLYFLNFMKLAHEVSDFAQNVDMAVLDEGVEKIWVLLKT
jgi:hypothetical protein